MTGRFTALFIVVASFWLPNASSAQGQGDAKPLVIPAPASSSLDDWQQYIWPADDEVRWMKIPWHPTFGGGLAAAGRAGKPLLFYAMNGHPLGCT